MLISTLRFYERILLGLHAPDEETQGFALGCMSYLILHFRERQLVLPSRVAGMLAHLPEGDA